MRTLHNPPQLQPPLRSALGLELLQCLMWLLALTPHLHLVKPSQQCFARHASQASRLQQLLLGPSCTYCFTP